MGKMSAFRRALRSCAGKPLAYDIESGFGAVAAGMLQRVAQGQRVHDADIHEMFVGAGEDDVAASKLSIVAGPTIITGPTKGKNIAVVPVKGVAMYDIEYQPIAFSTFGLSLTMKALAADPEIGTIILDIDSPGGMVTGTQEAADAVFAARTKKRVVALINPLAASAAYWIASQASEIVAVPSGDIGSIGVFMAHTDCSAFNERQGMKITYIHAAKYKVEGNSDEPLSDEARAQFQSEVDVIYDKFVSAVARGRSVSKATVLKDFGEGRCLMAEDALKAGMIDSIATVDQALARWGVMLMQAPSSGGRRGEEVAPGQMALEAASVVPSLDTDEERSEVPANAAAETNDAPTDAIASDAPSCVLEVSEEFKAEAARLAAAEDAEKARRAAAESRQRRLALARLR